MVISELIGHLPDLSDLVKDHQNRLKVVEVAEWKNGSIGPEHPCVIRYVAGRAVIDRREYLVAGSSRSADMSLISRELYTADTVLDYRVILKLEY